MWSVLWFEASVFEKLEKFKTPEETYHFFQGELDKVLNAFVRVFLSGLLDQRALEHVEHFLSRDVAVTVQVVNVKTNWNEWAHIESLFRAIKSK